MLFGNITALFLFAGALVCTPGPANMLLMSSGAKFGWRASLPLIMGVSLGKLFIHLSLALGFWKIIGTYPQVLVVMKFVGFGYILWLAYKILGISIQRNNKVKALSFFSGLVVHPSNPKAWVMIIAAYGQFMDLKNNWWLQATIIALIFFFWTILAHNFWCFLGEKTFQKITKSNRKKEKIICFGLAVLMIAASLWAILS